MSFKVSKLTHPFTSFITLGAVNIKLLNFTFETFMNDVAKLFPFGTAVRTAFPNSEVFAEPFVQARSTVVLTTAYDQMGISKRFSAYLTDEAFGNFVDKIVIVATQSLRARTGSPYVWSKFTCNVKVHYVTLVFAH